MSDEEYIERAISLAARSSEPVGCGTIIVKNGKIIAEAWNSQSFDNIAVHHAEIKAVIQANEALGLRKLKNAIAYCSCEPCAMCLTALSYANVERIVFSKSMMDLFPDDPQSKLNSYDYVKGLNFIPVLEQFS